MQNIQRRKLTNIFILPKFQNKLVAIFSLVNLILLLTFAAIFYIYIKENYTVFMTFMDMSEEAKAQLNNELLKITTMMSLAGLAFIFFSSILILFFSHRIAGPIFQLSAIFKKIKEGHTEERLHLRPNDQFIELANEFNEMMDSLQKDRPQ